MFFSLVWRQYGKCCHFHLYNEYKWVINMAIKFKRISDLRTDNDLLQREIADILGVNRNTYPHWEAGLYEMPLEIIDKLANYYNVSVDYLTGLSNYKGKAGRIYDAKISAKRIYTMRKSKKLSQEKMSEMMPGMSQMKLSRYENSVTAVPLSKLYLIAKTFNISMDYLMGKTDEIDIIKRVPETTKNETN